MSSINSRLTLAALTLAAVSLACEVFGRALSEATITPPVMTLVGPARTPEPSLAPASPTVAQPPAQGGTVLEAGEIPRLEDAQQVVDMGDTLTYLTSMSVDDAVVFYKQVLAVQGWLLEDEITLGTLATLEFGRDNQSLSLTAIESGDGVMVTIVISSG